ncbi:ribonuclease H family protein [Fusibacter ferrireducens]|uniref:ribonuclease H n=1 Tax=Fusibacter ferrireducens TaxID=2785058 RepID=A0ABR9ZRV8_9FIRM|nr:ribonuclease H [Fusibacter ferrireducens]MBF4693194.1 ribonuclease HI [Fusibacter ferrireducens]
MKTVEIFCDGACSGNGKETNVGGWGAVLVYNGQKKELFGGEASTTNNIMELTAVIEALKSLKTTSLEVHIFSDSAYVVNCFREGWYRKWQLNGWRNSKKEPVENKLLWETLINLVASFAKVEFYKIKGHLNLDAPADIQKWYKKFNANNDLQFSLEEFIVVSTYNHLADELANKGMAPYK